MKLIYLFLIFLFTYCTVSTENSIHLETQIDKPFLGKLSEVVALLKDDPVQGYVLIHYETLEYSSAEAARGDTSAAKSIAKLEGKHFHIHMPMHVQDSSKYNFGSPFVCRKVVKDYGEVIEVITLDEGIPEKLGSKGRGADYMFNINTFLRKKDLVPVLARSCKKSFEDGTFLKLDPGVAIGIPWNGNENKRVMSIQQMHFEFNVPDSLLALSYKPVIRKLSDIAEQAMLDEKDTLYLGGEVFCPVSEIRIDRLRTPVNHLESSRKNRAKLVNNGIEMSMIYKKNVVASYVPNNDRPNMSPAFKKAPRWYYRVDEGTPVYWKNGRRAGMVRQYFGYQSTTGPQDVQWCDVIREFLPNALLCFDVKDIEVLDNRGDK